MGGETGTGGMRKTALVVEDNANLLMEITKSLGSRGYNVTPVNYLNTKDIPQDNFDLLVVDGLDGMGINMLRCVHAKRKFLYTGSFAMHTVAKAQGIEAHFKKELLDEILRDKG